MSISCIEILTPNLLENATLSESGNAKTYTFSEQIAVNKIIVKNTNLTALTICMRGNLFYRPKLWKVYKITLPLKQMRGKV